jgi:CDP-glycerol glycerophosphotransferase
MLIAIQALNTVIAIVAHQLLRKPKKPVITLYGHQLSGNLKALYIEWQQDHQDQFDCYFLTLDPQYYQQLREQNVRVLKCSRLQDMIAVGRSDAIITDHGLLAMSPLVRFTSILFIDVWHGIPFKGFIPEDFRLQHRYNEVWVSSPLLKKLYQNQFGFPAEIVRDLGYARTDPLFLRVNPDVDYLKTASIPKGNRIVLYAPTWQQDHNGRDMFPFGESQHSFVKRLSETCEAHRATLIIRSHLNASIEGATHNNARYCSMKDFPDSEALLQNTDILICDWSSIAFDYLALDRPTVFLDVTPPFKHGFSLGKEYRFGKVVSDMNTLCVTVDKILEQPESYASDQEDRHRDITSAVYGDNTDGKSAERQWSRLAELVKLRSD